MANPEMVQEMLSGLGSSLAKRLSVDDLPLTSLGPFVLGVEDETATIPLPEPDPVRTHVVLIAREGEVGVPTSGFLMIGLQEARSDSFFWGLVGPRDEPFNGNFEQLAKVETLRREIWGIQGEIPARSMLRWFGLPSGGPAGFVEIQSMGSLGSQMSTWATAFSPSAVMFDLPARLLAGDAQRSLPQLIGGDLSRLLPLLRLSHGLSIAPPDQELVSYPVEIPDPRRQVPLIFLSYSRKDDEPEGNGPISQLFRALEGRQPGLTFLDARALRGGDRWRDLIDARLAQTAVFALVVSVNSLRSSEVEIEFSQFVGKLVDQDWPGIVLPIPLDADSFEFFRDGQEGGSIPWWARSGSLNQEDPSDVGLATFNFERRSLDEAGPDQTAVRLLGVYSQHRDSVQDRLSSGAR